MALVTFSSYPPIEKQLENLTNGLYCVLPHYDIADKLRGFERKQKLPSRNTPRFKTKFKQDNYVPEYQNNSKKSKMFSLQNSDSEFSDNEETQIQRLTPRKDEKKDSKQLGSESKKKQAKM